MLEHFGKSDWSELETDVIGGVFSPPVAGKQAVPQGASSRRPPRNSELYNATIPGRLFHYDPATRTYKSTIGRLLREHAFNILITLRDEGITFEFERTARCGLDWHSMHYRSTKPPGLRMCIVNNDFSYAPDPDDEVGIRVVRDGIYFVAKFKYTKVNCALVERSGFEFDAKVKWWFTLDPEVAARLEAQIAGPSEAPAPPARRQVPAWVKRRYAAQRRCAAPKRTETRKPIIRTWR